MLDVIFEQYHVQIHADEEFLAKLTGPKCLAILGSEEFIKIIVLKVNQENTPEIPDQKPIVKLIQPTLSTIENIICDYYQVSEEELKKSKQKLGNSPRKVAMYVACKHSGQSHQLIANFFGNTSRYGVAKIFKTLRNERENNIDLANAILEIEALLQTKLNLQ